MAAISQQQLEDAAKDADAIAAFANGDETTDVVTRTGAVYPSQRKLVATLNNDGTIAAVQAVKAQAEAARDAATDKANVYAELATGLAAVADGAQFMVISGNEIVRYKRNNAGSSTEVARYASAGGSPIYRGAPADATIDFNTLTTPGTFLITGPQYNAPLNGTAPRPALLTVRNFGTYAIQEYTPINGATQYGSQKYTRIINTNPVSMGAWVQNFGYMGALGVGPDLNNIRTAGIYYADNVPFNKPQDPDAPTTGIVRVDVLGNNIVQQYMGLGGNFNGAIWTRTIIASSNTIGDWFRNDFYKGTLTAGNANALTDTGNYLIGGEVDNFPEESGWLTVSRRGDWVLQQCLPLFGGALKTRTYHVSANQWSDWIGITPGDGSITADMLGNQFDYKATLTDGDLNDYTESGGWMVAGQMANAPTGSGWLFVHRFGDTGQFVLQRFYDFGNPERSYTRRFYNLWSSWVRAALPGETKTNKKVVCLGDSITEFGDYPARLSTLTGAAVVNAGFGGTRLAQHAADYDPLSLYRIAGYINSGDWSPLIAACNSLAGPPSNDDNRAIAATLAAVDWSTVDYIVCLYGTNDFAGNNPLGNNGDATGATLKGAINYTVQKICSAYPNIKLLFVTPPWRARVNGDPVQDPDTTANDIGKYLTEYVDAIISTANANKMPALDMYRTSGINKYNWATLIPDGVHPAPGVGFQRIAEKVAAGLNANW